METQTQYREAAEAAVATVFQSTSLPEQAIFRKEGEFWTVGFGGKAFRLKDTKGLGYLAHLLRHPAAEVHVLDLAGGIAGERDEETGQSARGLPRRDEDLEKAGIHITSLGDAGEMLDEQAKVLIDAGCPSCGKNWRKPRGWETSSARSTRKRRSTR